MIRRHQTRVSNDMDHEIKHGDYMHTMTTNEQLSRNVVALSYHNHKIRTIKNPKITLNNFHGKMQLINCIDCVQFGYTFECSTII